MPYRDVYGPNAVAKDIIAGVVVALIALPLCLGIAFASGAPLFSGLIAGVVGGVIVGFISRSHTSVSGPAAGLTAVVMEQITEHGFAAFLLVLLLAGVLQVVLGLIRAGSIANFVPSSVVRGLLAAIGVILILKQVPHVLGHDKDPEGDMAFFQYDQQNTFSEILELMRDYHFGAAAIGLASVLLILFWDRIPRLKKSPIPSALVVVLFGVTASQFYNWLGGYWVINGEHLVDVPVAQSLLEMRGFLTFPDWSAWTHYSVYVSSITLCIVATLETLLNLEAVDKLDPWQRQSDPNRELVAQGVGNIVCGAVGGIPVTSVIIRSSANINAGARTKLSTITHGSVLLLCVSLLPSMLNMIPISCLAAILLVTGFKLASPKLVRELWSEGLYQFIPFVVTVVAIVLTDLLIGIAIGLAVSIAFILSSNIRRPVRRVFEKHIGGEVQRVVLASQVSFLNRAALNNIMNEAAQGSHILFDARNTDYIDPDVLSMLKDFKSNVGPARGISVSTIGFRNKYQIHDDIVYVDYATRSLQEKLTPQSVLEILMQGNERFRNGQRLTRDLGRQVEQTSAGQHPLAVILSCIDSRTPSELIFDLGLGDIFSVRVAGNVVSPKVLGSIEFACAIAGAKLVLVVGHTRCGAVKAAVQASAQPQSAAQVHGCEHLETVVRDIQRAFAPPESNWFASLDDAALEAYANQVATQNVLQSVAAIRSQSRTLAGLCDEGKIAVLGALYDVSTGRVHILDDAQSIAKSGVAFRSAD